MKKISLLILLFLLAIFPPISDFQYLGSRHAIAEDLKACKVTVSIVETIYAGKEAIFFSPVFEIYNPNKRDVYLSKFSYELDVKDFYFAGQQIPVSLYIPAEGKASFSGALPAAWVGMSLWLMQVKGISMGAGMKEVIPIWKSWGGKLFNPKLKEVWGKAEVENPEFVFNGQFEIRRAKYPFPFTATWKMD